MRKTTRRPRKSHVGIILERREETWPLAQLGRLLPSKPNYKRLWKWCKVGRLHPETKKPIQMESVQEADKLTSSIDAYWRFIGRLNDA